MRTKTLAIGAITALAVSPSGAGSAQAAMIGGWDFSQWAGDGALITDGTTFALVDTLDANYSSLDPSDGAGAESAAFGTLYFNGQFGSTDVDETAFPPVFAPSAAAPDSLSSNLNAPVAGGGPVPFDSHTILQAEGQDFANLLSMIATTPLSVVFEVDLSSVPEFGSDWSVSFGGKTSSGTSAVGIEFSTDGLNYTSFGSVNLSSVDAPFSVNLGAGASDLAFVRFNFSPAGVDRPFIDNVAINATTAIPEPGTALLCGLGLVGLALAGRRRRTARG
jgi:hypothetical protein